MEYDKFTLGECEFSIAPLDPFTALKMLGDLQKLILPALGKGIGGAAGKFDMNADVADLIGSGNLDALSDAIGQVSLSLDGDTLTRYSRALLLSGKVSVSISGSDPERLSEGLINKIFTQNLSAMFKLIAKVIQVNYGDFFTLSAGLFGKAKAAVVKAK